MKEKDRSDNRTPTAPGGVSRVGDLKVYRELVRLHLEIHNVSLTFPDFEKFELGSQIRRSSNSAPANLAEGFNSRYKNMYLQSLNRAMGELRGTQHHLLVAHKKGYVGTQLYQDLMHSFSSCGQLLRGLEKSIAKTDPQR
jgi:four helix bundle protein